jgi:hypothetical protein
MTEESEQVEVLIQSSHLSLGSRQSSSLKPPSNTSIDLQYIRQVKQLILMLESDERTAPFACQIKVYLESHKAFYHQK